MSHRAVTWALSQRGLTPAQKLVLIHLADRHNPDLGCFPSHARIAEDAEISVRSVCNHLTALESRGLVERVRHRRKGSFASTEYLLNMEPSANSAVGKGPSAPSAKLGSGRPQDLPTNPVREPVREPISASAHTSADHVHEMVKKPTPRDVLAPVVGNELANAFVEMRSMIRAPLTVHAAKLLEAKLQEMPEHQRKQAVEVSVERGWRGVFPPSSNRQERRASDPLARQVDYWAERARTICQK